MLFGQVCVGEISVNDSNKVGWGIGFDFYIHYNISTYIFCCYSANVEQREEEEKKWAQNENFCDVVNFFLPYFHLIGCCCCCRSLSSSSIDEELEFSTGTKLWNVETTKSSPSLGEDYGWKLTGVFIAREKFSHALSNHKIIVKCDYNTVAELQCDDVMSSRCNSLSGVVHKSEREIIFQLYYISSQLTKLRATSAHRMVRKRRKKKTPSNARGESCIVRAQRCPIQSNLQFDESESLQRAHIFADRLDGRLGKASESVARRGSRTRRRKKEEERGDDERVREEIGGNNKPKLNRKTVTEIYVD